MYHVTGNRGVDDLLAMPCGSRRTAQIAATRAKAEGWRDVQVTEEDTDGAWRAGVQTAVRELFPCILATKIEQSSEFGDLVQCVRERARTYNHTPEEVLRSIPTSVLAFTGRADAPAVFLTAKVRELLFLAPESTSAPREVVEIIDAVRAFTGSVEWTGAEKFGQAVSQLNTAELAWVIDRLDDVRQSVTLLLTQMTKTVQRRGADRTVWGETLADLESAGDGLYAAMQHIDPDSDRHNIIGHL